MAEEPIRIVLEHLRRIDRKVDDLGIDMRQVALRLGAIKRHLAGLNIYDVQRNSEIDRIEARLDRVERLLELT
jgi:hypothetical protein